jgi:GDP-mannose 6-dehydrogenase
MILHLAGRQGVDLPLLRSLLPSNDAHLKRAMDMVPDDQRRRIGLNGLAFKAGTDDLRESPIVIIAEHLIGKGHDLKIHDAGLETSRITGANREYIEKRIPHLSSRLVSTLDELIDHSEILLVTRDGDGLLERATQRGKRPMIIDLRGRMPQSRKAAAQAVPAPQGRSRAAVPSSFNRVASNGSSRRLKKANGKVFASG